MTPYYDERIIQYQLGQAFAEEPALEGTNIRAIGIFLNYVKTNLRMTADIKAAEKRGDYRTASSIAHSLIANCDTFERQLKALPESSSSATLFTIILITIIMSCTIAGAFAAKPIVDKTAKYLDTMRAAGKTFKDMPFPFSLGQNKIVAAIFNSFPKNGNLTVRSLLVYYATGCMTSALTGKVIANIMLKMGFADLTDWDDCINSVSDVNANDMNQLIAAIRNDVRRAKEAAQISAAQFDHYVASMEGGDESMTNVMTMGAGSLIQMEASLDAYMDHMTYAMEGANIDAIKIWSQRLKEIGALKKEMKALERRGDYSNAAKKAADIAKAFEKYSNMLDEIPSSASSAVLAAIAILLAVAAVTGLVVLGARKLKERSKGYKDLVAKRDADMKQAEFNRTFGIDYDEARDMLQYRMMEQNPVYGNYVRAGEKWKSLKKSNADQNLVDAAYREFDNLAKELYIKHGGPPAPDEDAVAKLAISLVNKEYDSFTNQIKASFVGQRNIMMKSATKAGAIIGMTSSGMFLIKKGIFGSMKTDAERPLNANDFNVFINCLRVDCLRGKEGFLKLSYWYTEMANEFPGVTA